MTISPTPSDSLQTEAIDRLFLELSQVTRATTAKELALQSRINSLLAAMRPFATLIETTSGHIPASRLSLADWHNLTKAYRAAVQEAA